MYVRYPGENLPPVSMRKLVMHSNIEVSLTLPSFVYLYKGL